MSDLLDVRTAQQRILDAFPEARPATLPLRQLYRQVLAADVLAAHDLPPFTNSSMDGFAVHSRDVQAAAPESPVALPVTQDIPAGAQPRELASGEAARIMTGAPLPPGADAVVPVEQTDAYRAAEPDPFHVNVYASVHTGDYVRPQGQDIRQGAVVFPAGRELAAQDVALLASFGYAQAKVYARPRVAIFSSGDELMQPGEPLLPGKIYDANQFALLGLLEEAGAQVISQDTLPDNPAAISTALTRAVSQQPDLIVSTAGVSVGNYDFVKQVIEAQGKLGFWRVNMRPGKPLAFGAFMDVPFVGLPGNPVSAFVGALVFVLPIIRKLRGLDPFARQLVQATLLEPVDSDGRESYLRATLSEKEGKHFVSLKGHQGSGNLYALTQSNALLILPSGVKSLPAGDLAQVWQLQNLP